MQPGLSWGTDAARGAQGASCSSPELDGLAVGMGEGPGVGKERVCAGCPGAAAPSADGGS